MSSTHARIRNEIYVTKNIYQKAGKIHPIFHKYAPSLHYYIPVKFNKFCCIVLLIFLAL